MSSSQKKLALLALVLSAAAIGLWWAGFFKAFSAPPIKVAPRNGSNIALPKPKIEGNWKLFPFASLKIDKVFLDGSEITSQSMLSATGFFYLPPDNLKEGKHSLRFTGTYRFILSKPLAKQISFTVDTVSPFIELVNGSEMVASSGTRAIVGGKTEPGSKLSVAFNGRHLPAPKLYYGGSFWMGVNLNKPVNDLEIKAEDKAGNVSTRTFKVLIDQDNPRILSFSPVTGSDKKSSPLKMNQPEVEVEVVEDTSAVEQIRIWIDGIECQPEYAGSKKEKAVVKPGVLAEGTHTVEAKASDLAHNLATASWSFTIDSTETFGNNLLYPGAMGADVRELQARLMAVGVGPKYADGTYKQATTDAVRALQQSKGLTLTGQVGSAELNILKPQKLDTSAGPIPGARMELSVSQRSLTLYDGERVVKVYPVAVGMGGRFATPTGHFYVKKKEINPTWFPPDWADTTEPVHPGPNNPLGNRRLLLNITAYGIHGTNKPSSIGKAVTHGCIRMYPSDILELFEVVSVGTKVDIIR